jgi:hypothetical protein
MEEKKILELLGKGVSIPKVAKLLKTNRIRVWRLAKKFEKAGKLVRTCKRPATYRSMMPSDVLVSDSMLSETLVTDHHRNLIHKAHRLKFSIDYKGRQPTIGATEVKPFGRYGTAKQVVFKLGDITIVAFKRKLNVWVHNPPGKLTQDQIIRAREQAYLSLLAFAEKHRISLEADLSQVLRSHHVVEHKSVNEGLKPVFEAHGEEIEKRIGSKICKTSHKGKIEHEGKSKELTGAHVAQGMEWLLINFPTHFSMLAQAQGEYNTNIKLHLGVLQKMSDTLDKIQEKL